MLVKDVILKACVFLEYNDLANAIKNDEDLDDELESQLDMLIKCLNLVRNELASEYLPIIKTEKIIPIENRVDFVELSGRVVNILSVKDNLGDNVKFKVYDSYLYAYAPEVNITYSTLPDELGLDDSFECVIPERILAYGIVRENYFIQTLYEDAEIWDERFKNGLQSIERKKSETVMPRRRWL